MNAVKFIGYAWCVAVVVAYLAYRLMSEHGGGILFESGYGDYWVILLACLPGIGLIKLANSKTRRE
jgi:hypothetical protein